MSESRPAQLPAQRFTLNARPPVRPLAIGAGAAVVAAVLLVVAEILELPSAVVVLAVLLLAMGVALAAAALLLTARLRTEVRLDPTGITVSRRRQERSVTWGEVTEVSMSHPRLSLLTAERGSGLVVVNPRPADDPVFTGLVDQIRQRLDRDRGYTDLPG